MRRCRKCEYYQKKDLKGFSIIRKIQSVSGFCMNSDNEDFNGFAQAYGRGICRTDSFTSPKWCRFRNENQTP